MVETALAAQSTQTSAPTAPFYSFGPAVGAVSTIELMATGLIAAAVLLVTMSTNWLKAG